ncbi:putative RING-H2 finger protein ATL21A [Impatiens glandulifera]|uniref:putative RING-H2 finger protein ATL21A n=1 Tax=Impatiens glandulifera TaxID=253017 RepID=UPI001FB08F7B|nr:putative RING-H2 finger protein ATL21A [Impatiens glandulifera]
MARLVLFSLFFFFLSILLQIQPGVGAADDDECKPEICGDIVIRFPFRLIERHSDHCGYHGFDLSCSPNYQTILNLPLTTSSSSSSNVVVITHIDYGSQMLYAEDPDGCFVKNFENFNFSASPFQLFHTYDIFYYFSCPHDSSYKGINSSELCPPYYELPCPVDCASDSTQQVYAVSINAELYNLPPWPCKSITKISDLKHFSLNWSEPMCGHCESLQKLCRFRDINNTQHNLTEHETECYGELKQVKQPRDFSKKLIITGYCLTSLVILVGVSLTYSILTSDDNKRY